MWAIAVYMMEENEVFNHNVANGNLSAGHARALISVPQIDQIKLAENIVKDGASVRDVEKMVKDYFTPPEEKAKKKVKQELSLELKELIMDMQNVIDY